MGQIEFTAKKAIDTSVLEHKWGKVVRELIKRGYKINNTQKQRVNTYILNKVDFENTLKEFVEIGAEDKSGQEFDDENYKGISDFSFSVQNNLIIIKCKEGIP